MGSEMCIRDRLELGSKAADLVYELQKEALRRPYEVVRLEILKGGE